MNRDPGQTNPDDLRDRDISTWAHELRGPLNAILGWSDLLSTGGSPEDVLHKGLTAIASNARRLAAIIKQMEDSR